VVLQRFHSDDDNPNNPTDYISPRRKFAAAKNESKKCNVKL